jgi:Tfp pilus assembly protein PilZ
MNDERRSFPRLHFSVEVVCQKLDINVSQFPVLNSHSKNISASGIRIVTKERFESGNNLGMNFFLPDYDEPIYAIGKVVWTKEIKSSDPSSGVAFDAGVRFLKIKAEDRDKINQYVVMRIK